jgi:hypothetical protein
LGSIAGSSLLTNNLEPDQEPGVAADLVGVWPLGCRMGKGKGQKEKRDFYISFLKYSLAKLTF